MVRLKGLEPPRHRHQILSLARLPIPPQPHIKFYLLIFTRERLPRGGAYRLILIYENGNSVINNNFTEVVETKPATPVGFASENLAFSLYHKKQICQGFIFAFAEIIKVTSKNS